MMVCKTQNTNCRTAIKVLLLFFNLYLSVKLPSQNIFFQLLLLTFFPVISDYQLVQQIVCYIIYMWTNMKAYISSLTMVKLTTEFFITSPWRALE
jgi:phosphate starvation-inducible membrane PsiE